ncbi:M20/M25/M40 family metallo-hydrolase [Bacillus mojavensis]
MKKLKDQLMELLSIYAPSKEEAPVTKYVVPILKMNEFSVNIDDYGNVLAEKKMGTGDGATVLLSAHMDTVFNVYPDRELLDDGDIIISSKGALGADDRAGIAIILTVLRNFDQISFDGIIKIAFSKEEEIGCVGAKKIDPEWYKDVDLAIVVDRRGNSDIVVGCMDAFCSDTVGTFVEECAKMSDMNWNAVEGGISDAMIFSGNGINSINLSAGYYNEHTEREYVCIEDMKRTIQLIMQIFAVINHHYADFGKVPMENQWVQRYSEYSDFYKYRDEELSSIGDIWVEKDDVYAYGVSDQIILQQGNNEIVLPKADFKDLMKQLESQI